MRPFHPPLSCNCHSFKWVPSQLGCTCKSNPGYFFKHSQFKYEKKIGYYITADSLLLGIKKLTTKKLKEINLIIKHRKQREGETHMALVFVGSKEIKQRLQTILVTEEHGWKVAVEELNPISNWWWPAQAREWSIEWLKIQLRHMIITVSTHPTHPNKIQ